MYYMLPIITYKYVPIMEGKYANFKLYASLNGLCRYNESVIGSWLPFIEEKSFIIISITTGHIAHLYLHNVIQMVSLDICTHFF